MLCPEELATVTTAAAISLAQGRSTEELNILAAVFTQIGDVLATIAVQRGALEACCEQKCSQDNPRLGDAKIETPSFHSNIAT